MTNEKKPVGICRFCGSPLYKSDLEEYTFECLNCDEDFYYFEQYDNNEYASDNSASSILDINE